MHWSLFNGIELLLVIWVHGNIFLLLRVLRTVTHNTTRPRGANSTTLPTPATQRHATNTTTNHLGHTHGSMGGKAFAAAGKSLVTPRMPKLVYEAIKARCHGILRTMYTCVASPIDGPGKQDFGDVDILVAWPHDSEAPMRQQLQAIADALGATDTIFQNADCSSNLAIPWPSDAGTELPRHVQVDVRVCADMQTMHWMLFRHAHSDMWNIIGSIIRPYGLTIDETALWLRIPEVEEYNRTQAKIHLTSEPSRVLAFLGLPLWPYWETPFASLEEMFMYAERLRMLWVRPDEDRNSLKSNDRRRMSKRPAFRKWVDEFLPSCRDQGRFLQRRTSRAEVAHQAFDTFGVEDAYEVRRREMMLERQRQVIWNEVIKPSVPSPDRNDPKDVLFRGCQLKALKRIILEDDASYGVCPEQPLQQHDGFFDIDAVRDFVTSHQQEVGEAAVVRHHSRYAERKATS